MTKRTNWVVMSVLAVLGGCQAPQSEAQPHDAFDEFETGPQCGLRAWECEPTLNPTLKLLVDIRSPEDCTQDPDWVRAAPGLTELWYPHRRFLLQVDEETPVVTIAENARLARSTCEDVCPSYLDTPAGFENMAALASSGAVPVRTLTAGSHSFHSGRAIRSSSCATTPTIRVPPS